MSDLFGVLALQEDALAGSPTDLSFCLSDQLYLALLVNIFASFCSPDMMKLF